MPRIKEAQARIKAIGPDDGLEEGQFRALVSVFGNEDSMGDVIAPGAFAQVLAEWKASGDPIPVVWSHKWGDIDAHIGSVLEATETAEGLEVLAQIEDMDLDPAAAKVHRKLKRRLIKQFSFAYDVGEGGWVDTDDLVNHPWGEYYEIKRFSRLYEVGPCLVGANQQTDLLAVKAAELVRGAKAGRVLSQANYDTLSAAYTSLSAACTSIGEVLAAAEPQKASRPPAKAASPSPAQVAAWVTAQEMTMRRTA